MKGQVYDLLVFLEIVSFLMLDSQLLFCYAYVSFWEQRNLSRNPPIDFPCSLGYDSFNNVALKLYPSLWEVRSIPSLESELGGSSSCLTNRLGQKWHCQFLRAQTIKNHQLLLLVSWDPAKQESPGPQPRLNDQSTAGATCQPCAWALLEMGLLVPVNFAQLTPHGRDKLSSLFPPQLQMCWAK